MDVVRITANRVAREIIQKEEEIFGGKRIPPYLRIPLEKSDSSSKR